VALTVGAHAKRLGSHVLPAVCRSWSWLRGAARARLRSGRACSTS
jgi:hypothetical protein